MKITEKQLHMLFQIAVDSFLFDSHFKFLKKDRIALVEAILSQQSEEIKEIGEL